MQTLERTLNPAFRKDTFLYLVYSGISITIFYFHDEILSALQGLSGTLNSTTLDSLLPWIPYILALLPMLGVMSTMLKTYLTSYEFQDKRVIIRRGVTYRVADPIEYYRIKDVVIETSLIEAIFGLSKMIIFSTDRTNPELRMCSVSKKKIHELEPLLRDKIEASKEGGRGREVDIV